MTSIKDRMKLFETNGPPIKPKISSPPRKLSNTQSETNEKSDRKIQKNSDNATGVSSPNNQTDKNTSNFIITKNCHEESHDNSYRNIEKSTVISHDIFNIKHKSVEIINDSINEDQEDSERKSKEDFNLKGDDDNDVIVHTHQIQKVPHIDPIVSTVPEVEQESDTDSLEDFSYECHGSIYHLPGLENFIFPDNRNVDQIELLMERQVNEINFNKVTEQSLTNPTIDMIKNEIEHDRNSVAIDNNIKRTPSKRLIEEIFNTSIWRNSVNYNDNFIFNPPTMTTEMNNGVEYDSSDKATDISSIMSSSSPSNDERRKSTSSLSSSKPNLRNIFSGMFRSKRGAKKSQEKLSNHDQILNDTHHSDGHEKASRHSKVVEGDTDSVEQVTKKPLNSIFNRDWLNSLGEGIKKKANVMSELKKVFSHGKAKHLKKPQKIRSDASSIQTGKSASECNKANPDDDIYDDSGEDSLSTEDECPNKSLPLPKIPPERIADKQINYKKPETDKKQEFIKIYPNEEEIYDCDESDVSTANESVYNNEDNSDNEDNNDNDDRGNDNSHLNLSTNEKFNVKNSSQESVYDNGDDEILDENQIDMDKDSRLKSLSHESVYEDEEEDIPEEVPIVEMRQKKISNLKSNPIFNSNIPFKTSQPIQGMNSFTKTSTPNSIINTTVVNDSIYDDEGENDDINISGVNTPRDNSFNKIQMKNSNNFTDDLDKNSCHKSVTSNSTVEGNLIKNEDHLKNIKKSHKKWFFQKKPKTKTKCEGTKKSEKKMPKNSTKKKSKIKIPTKSKTSDKNEEYDIDDEDIEEYENDVENDIDSTTQKLTDKNNLKVKLEEDVYDMDPVDPQDCVSNENEIENIKPILNQLLENLIHSGKSQPKIYKNQKTFDDDVEIEPQQSQRKSDIYKKDKKTSNKINKKFVEEYQIDIEDQWKTHKISKETKKVNPVKVAKIPTQISSGNLKKKKAKGVDYEYDDDEAEENDIEVYVSDEEIVEEKDLLKSKSTAVFAKSKKNKNNIKVENNNTEKGKSSTGKQNKSTTKNEIKTKKSAKNSKLETYIYDEDDSECLDDHKSRNNKCSDDEFFNTDDPDIRKIIKKNLNQAKKTFKINDEVKPISLSKALKTVYSQRKNHIQLNIGELVQVLTNKDDFVLVRNGVGKCGWTSPGNLQIIKIYQPID